MKKFRAEKFRTKKFRMRKFKVKKLRVKRFRQKELRVRKLRMKEIRAKELRMKDIRVTGVRTRGLRVTETGAIGPRETDSAATEARVGEIRMKGPRIQETDRTEVIDRQETAATREAALRRIVLRTTAAGTIEDREVPVEQTAGRIEASSSPEEAADRGTGLRVTDRMDLREMADRVLKAVKLIVAVREVVRAVTVILTAVRVTAEAMADREPDSEIINRLRASLERLRQRTLRRSARKIRDGQIVRRRESAPKKITSTKKMKR